jgi:diguanylate cyclase (GGDEF)-like protein
MKLLLMGSTPHQTAELENLLEGNQLELFRADQPGRPWPSSLFPTLSLIIVSELRSDLGELLNCNEIPSYIPILIIGEATAALDEILKQRTFRVIDYLREPFSGEYLLFKLRMLEHLRNLGEEHYRNIKAHNEFLDRLSTRDGLTGLYNRRQLTKILHDEMAKAERNEGELSLLILDIDYFNEVNKSVGHSYGDSVLNEMSARLTKVTRPEDTCFRFSGEDFVILMPGADVDQAYMKAEKLRTACAAKPFSNGSVKKHITVSIGIASLRKHHPENQDEFITMTETALNMAKAEGRNRCNIFSPLEVNSYSTEKNLASLKVTIARILDKTRSSAISSLQLLAKNLAGAEHRDHIQNVSHYINLLGYRLGLPVMLIKTFQNAITLNTSIRFLLHNDIISQEKRFNRIDRQKMNEFPYKLAEITEVFDYFSNERSILLYHGEHYDGSGFPEGLKGEEIPLGARIFNIVDSLAAMNSDRPYRRKLKPKAIIKELSKQAGKQFDPFLVLRIFDIIEENQLLDLDQSFMESARAELLNNNPGIEL